jgi:ABC-type transporter Mla subunit MlaD
MSDKELRDLLSQLHGRLGNTKSLSAEERRGLTTVLHDIEKVLARNDAEVDAPKPRLEALAVKFEADHPALADSIRQLADLLAKVGI